MFSADRTPFARAAASGDAAWRRKAERTDATMQSVGQDGAAFGRGGVGLPLVVASKPHGFARGLDSASILAVSERVAWTVDDVFRDRRFDATGSIVPASWVGTQDLDFLDERDQRTLNHCR